MEREIRRLQGAVGITAEWLARRCHQPSNQTWFTQLTRRRTARSITTRRRRGRTPFASATCTQNQERRGPPRLPLATHLGAAGEDRTPVADRGRIKNLHESMNAVRGTQLRVFRCATIWPQLTLCPVASRVCQICKTRCASKTRRSPRRRAPHGAGCCTLRCSKPSSSSRVTTWQNLYLKSFFEVRRVV